MARSPLGHPRATDWGLYAAGPYTARVTELADGDWLAIPADAKGLDAADTPITLRLEGDRFTASAGGNRLMGAVEREGEAVTFGPLASTRMMPPPEVLARERALAAALKRATRLAVAGDVLRLFDAGGAEVASFQRMKWGHANGDGGAGSGPEPR